MWLVHANRDDSITYARLVQALVLAHEHSGGQHFLDGIDSIQVFADRALRTCLQAEPATKTVRPADVQLTFNRVIAAAIPVPGALSPVKSTRSR